ncbi:MAG: hypothetical protein AAFQ55_00400 [Pseudomonadota bacterium]
MPHRLAYSPASVRQGAAEGHPLEFRAMAAYSGHQDKDGKPWRIKEQAKALFARWSDDDALV